MTTTTTDQTDAALLADLRARHAELVKAREEHHGNVRRAQEYLADAEKKDYGLAAVLGELETWIARAEAAQQLTEVPHA